MRNISVVAKDETNGSLSQSLFDANPAYSLHHNILCSIILHTIFFILGLYESMSQLDPIATQVKRPQYHIGLSSRPTLRIFNVTFYHQRAVPHWHETVD